MIVGIGVIDGVGEVVGVGVTVRVLEGSTVAVADGVNVGAMNGVIVGMRVDVGPLNGPRPIFKTPVLFARSSRTIPNRQISPKPAVANNGRIGLLTLVADGCADGVAAPGGFASTQSLPS